MSSSTGTVVFNDSRVRAVDVIANEKVGIGTSLPAYALDVHGTANVGTMNVETISSNVLFNGSATFDKALSVSGNLNASGDIKLSNAFFMNNTVIFHKEYEPWTQMGQDIYGEAGADFSGTSVSLSSDGTRMAIGAHLNDGNGSNSGHTRIWEWNGSTWTQMGQDIDGEAADDYSGYSVSLSSDGTRVAIGAYQNDGGGNYSGHTRIWEWNSGTSTWTQMGQDIDGETLINYSGYSVSISSDGTRVAIGAYLNNGNGWQSGHTRIWEWDSVNSVWTQMGQDIDGEASSNRSGYSVSLSGDGTRVAIGAIYNDGGGTYGGHARIWEWNPGTSTWIQMGQDIDGEAHHDDFGTSVSLSSDGTRVAIGANENDGSGSNSGHVRVYEWNSGTSTWTQMGQDIDGEAAGDQSGYSVSLSSNGTRVAIGARYNDGNGYNSGHTRIWEWNPVTSTWIQIGQDLDGEAADDHFGLSVSLSGDGTRVAIGAPSNASGQTRVYQIGDPKAVFPGRVSTSNLEVGTDLQVVGNAYVSSNLEIGTANLFVDTTTSNVGIGTTTPAYTLDVVGSAYFENIFMSGYVTHTLLNEAEFIWDPSSYLSYSGTGSTVYDINGNMNGAINNMDYYGESWRTTASNSRIQTASTIDLRRDWTILLWHRPPGTDTGNVVIAGHGQTAGSSGLHIVSASTSSIRYGMYGNDLDFGYSTGHVNRDRWRQYAFTYYHNGGVAGGVNRQAYQDERLVCDGQAGIGDGTNFPGDNYNPGGNFAALGYQPYQASPTVLRFGTTYGSGDRSVANNWFGPILFFGRVLSASEIRSLYRFYSMRFSHN